MERETEKNNDFKDYLQIINEIAEDDNIPQQDKIKKIIAAYDAEVKRILYTNQGLTPPTENV